MWRAPAWRLTWRSEHAAFLELVSFLLMQTRRKMGLVSPLGRPASCSMSCHPQWRSVPSLHTTTPLHQQSKEAEVYRSAIQGLKGIPATPGTM